MPKKYRVMLTETDRQQLQELISRGRAAARTLTRARILLKADEAEGGPAWTNAAIQAALDKVSLGLLDDHAHHCVIGAKQSEQHERTEELMGAVGRLMHRG